MNCLYFRIIDLVDYSSEKQLKALSSGYIKWSVCLFEKGNMNLLILIISMGKAKHKFL